MQRAEPGHCLPHHLELLLLPDHHHRCSSCSSHSCSSGSCVGDVVSADCIIAAAENRRVIPDWRAVVLAPEKRCTMLHCGDSCCYCCSVRLLWTGGTGVNQMTIRNNEAVACGKLTVARTIHSSAAAVARRRWSIRQVAAVAKWGPGLAQNATIWLKLFLLLSL